MTFATIDELKKHFGGYIEDACCESCQYPTKELHIFEDGYEGGRGRLIKAFAVCTVCYTTFAANAMRYPSQYEDKDVMQMLAHCTNMIIKAIKETKS